MIQKIGIAIPSYNEALNIPILIKRIFLCLPDSVIVVVDDSNVLENKKLKTNLEKEKLLDNKKVTLITRSKKSGRGSAVIIGFKELLKNKNIQYFFEMDGDLSHDPAESIKFLNAIKPKDVDMVIGSRYLKKSKTVRWPLWRLILSKCINTAINIWLGLSLSDYTNGYRLYKRNAVEFLTTVRLKEKGFIVLSESAYKLKKNNFKMVEVPITFTDRKHGKSSADYKEFTSSLLGIIRIKIFR